MVKVKMLQKSVHCVGKLKIFVANYFHLATLSKDATLLNINKRSPNGVVVYWGEIKSIGLTTKPTILQIRSIEMKKGYFAGLFLVIFSVLLGVRQLLAVTPTVLSLIAPVEVVDPYSFVEVELHVSQATDLAAYELELVYDPAYLAYVDMAQTGFMGNAGSCNPTIQRCTLSLGPKASANGQELGAYSYGNSSGGSGDGLLATLRLQSTGLPGSTTILLRNGLTSDSSAFSQVSPNSTVDIIIGTPTASTLRQTDVQPTSDSSFPLILLVVIALLLTIGIWFASRRWQIIGLLLFICAVSGLGIVKQSFAATWPANPDLNNDRLVDIVDIMLVAGDYGTALPTYDFDNNGIIDELDIDKIADRWHSRGSFVGLSSPAAGERTVAVTRETIFYLSTPIDPTTVISSSLYAQFAGTVLDTLIHVSPDNQKLTLFYQEPLPDSSRIEVVLNGDLIADTEGYHLDADNDGHPGGIGYLYFDTLSLTSFPGTTACGKVYASELGVDPYGNPIDMPLEGATITVDGRETELFTTTNANGEFCLLNAPAGQFYVHVDGRTASNPVPPGAYYPYVGKPWVSKIGETVDVGTVYLPLVAPETLQPVSQVSDTEIHFAQSVIDQYPEFAEVKIVVPADSLYADDGTRGGMVGIAPVAPDRLPGELPPDLDFPLVITVQTDSGSNFDQPAPVCFPNLPNPETGLSLPPGAESALWSFNHDTGAWEPAGPATVTVDGTLVCTDPGYGVNAPGWHGTNPFSFLKNPMCESLDWGDLWDIAKTGAKCIKKAPVVRQVILVADAAFEAGKVIGTTARTVYDAYNNGGYNSKGELIGAMGGLQEATEHLGDLANTVAEFSPYHQVVDMMDCAKEVADTGSSILCKAIKCYSKTVNSICEAVEELKDWIEHTGGKLGEFADSLEQLNQAEAVDQAADDLGDYVENMPDFGPDDPPDPYVLDELDGIADAGEAIGEGTEAADEVLEGVDGMAAALDEIYAGILALLSKPGAFQGGWACLNVNGFIPFWCGYWRTLTWRVPALEGYDITIYLHREKALLLNSGITARSGRTLNIDEYSYTLIFPDDADGDGDNIPDSVESSIGLDPINPDSDGDGLPDGAELDGGTDPLDGVYSFGAGIIATVNTPGIAQDVCAVNDLAVVADGATGVALIDVQNFENPIILNQLDTPGSANQVACGDGIVAVADYGYGLTILDIATPSSASLLRSVKLAGTPYSVELLGRTAYVGMNNAKLWLVDVDTGSILGSYTHTTAIRDLQISGNYLYVLGDNNVAAINLAVGPLHVANVVATDSGNLQLFAGGSLLDIVRLDGYATYSLADPSLPVLIAPESTAQRGWRQIVENGNGLGLAIVSPNNALGVAHDLWLYDLSDPSQTDVFLQAFATPGSARANALYGGLSYVADHDRGLQVVNYQAFDTAGTSPGIILSTNATPGLAEEGKLLRLTATITDDVEIRLVEFYADGDLINRDGNYPFEYRYLTPFASIQPTMTIQANATDTGGNISWTPIQTLTLVPDATPPQVLQAMPAQGETVLEETVSTIGLFFNEPLDSLTLLTTTVQLVEAGVDQLFGTGDDVLQMGGAVSFDMESYGVFLTFTDPLPKGLYQGQVGATVQDRAGNFLNTPYSWQFTVKAPIRWADPTGGNWTDASNWAGGVVPTSNDYVVIDLPGTYTVRVGAVTVAGLQILNPTATLNFDFQGLTITNDLVNYGIFHINGTLGDLTIPNGIFYNAGTILVSPGYAGINGNLYNAGLLDINSELFFTGNTTTLTNEGTIDILTGEYLRFSGNNVTFDQIGGTIQGNGDIRNDTSDLITINLSRGSLNNPTLSTLWNVTLNLNPDFQVITGYWAIRGTSSWNGDIPENLTMWFKDNSIVTAETGFNVYGTLRFNGYSSLTISNNQPVTIYGTLETTDSSNTNNFAGNLINYGLIDIGQYLQMSGANTHLDNYGTIQIASGYRLRFLANTTFNQFAGLVEGPGYLEGQTGYTGRTWNLSGGSFSGLSTSSIWDVNLIIAPEFDGGNNTIAVRGNNTLSGNIPAGTTLWLQSNSQITTSNNLANYGKLLLGPSAYGGTPYARVYVNGGNGTLTNYGTIETTINGGSGVNDNAIYGNLTNEGLLHIQHEFYLRQNGSTLINNGTIDIESGYYLNLYANDMVFRQLDGVVQRGGIRNKLDYTGQTWQMAGGIFTDTATHLLINGSLEILPTLIVDGEMVQIEGTGTVSGTIPTGLTLWIEVNATITATTGLINYGTLQMGAASGGGAPFSQLIVPSGYYLLNYGTVQPTNISSGSKEINGDVLNYGQFNLLQTIVLNKTGGLFENYGVIDSNDGVGLTLQNGYQLVNESAGIINGKGRVNITSGSFEDEGMFNPGGSGFAGQFDVTGAYTQLLTGTLNIEIGGLTVDTLYDRLATSLTCQVAGTVNLSLINGFEPNIGDSFTILTCSAVAGTFAQINGLDIGNGKQFSPTYNANNLVLTVVANP